MIEHALSLATASGSGAILGLIGNIISASVEKHKYTLDAARGERKDKQDAIKEHSKYFQTTNAHKVKRRIKIWGFEWEIEKTKPRRAINPPFGSSVLLITISYCICTIICFALGDIIIFSQNPTAEPTVSSWFWGFYRSEHSNDTIAVVTFASVGAYMAHFLAFILSAVITGVVPKRQL